MHGSDAYEYIPTVVMHTSEVSSLDGRNHAIAIAESLARVVAEISEGTIIGQKLKGSFNRG